MTETQRKVGHATHATIVITRCEGPEGRYLVAVCHPGTNREVRELSASEPSYEAAAKRGNDLWRQFNRQAIAQALDELPATRGVIAPAAELVAETEAYLAQAAAEQLLRDAVLAADVAKLSRPQRDAIASATAGHIARGNGVSVSTLYALEAAHLGVGVRRGYRVTGFDLSVRGLQAQAHILTHMNIHMHTAA